MHVCRVQSLPKHLSILHAPGDRDTPLCLLQLQGYDTAVVIPLYIHGVYPPPREVIALFDPLNYPIDTWS